MKQVKDMTTAELISLVVLSDAGRGTKMADVFSKLVRRDNISYGQAQRIIGEIEGQMLPDTPENERADIVMEVLGL